MTDGAYIAGVIIVSVTTLLIGYIIGRKPKFKKPLLLSDCMDFYHTSYRPNEGCKPTMDDIGKSAGSILSSSDFIVKKFEELARDCRRTAIFATEIELEIKQLARNAKTVSGSALTQVREQKRRKGKLCRNKSTT